MALKAEDIVQRNQGTLYFSGTTVKTPGVQLIHSLPVEINLQSKYILLILFQAFGIYFSIPAIMPPSAWLTIRSYANHRLYFVFISFINKAYIVFLFYLYIEQREPPSQDLNMNFQDQKQGCSKLS